MIITKLMLNDLTRQAQNSPRRGVVMGLRSTPED